jgi:hypothetical protein
MAVIDLDSYCSIKELAKEKGVTYDAARVWLRLHPEVQTKRVNGWSVLVKRSDVEEKYIPKGR